MKVFGDLEKGPGTDAVRAKAGDSICAHPREKKGRGDVDVGIYQQHQILLLKIESVLDLELKIGQKREFQVREQGHFPHQGFKLCNKLGSEGIITSARVAVTQDQDLGFGGFAHSPRWAFPRTLPSRPMTSTSSGIFPNAWVAQERQGS